MGLKSKAIYTALYKALNLATGFIAQFVLTPIILNGLGRQLFGIYSIINKAEGYLSFVDLRPTAVLRYKLAIIQGKEDRIEKRKYVGASISLSFLTLPIILFFGFFLSYYFPTIFNINEEYRTISQVAIMIIASFLAIKGFFSIPEAILRGNNLEYKGIYIEPLRYLIYGVLVILFLKLKFSLLGIVAAIILAYIVSFILKLIVQIKYCPEYSPLKPEKRHLKGFLNNGLWYLISSVGTQLHNSFDIVLIGILGTPEEVTIYALTKSILFRVSESIITVLSSITAGVGDLISRNETEKIINLRATVLKFSLIFALSLIGYFLCFNESFVALWVQRSNFAGNNVNTLLCIAILFMILAMAEEIFINSLLNFKKKSMIVLQAALIAISFSFLFYDRYGFMAIAVGLVLSKLYQFIHYAITINVWYPLRIQNLLKENNKILILIIYGLLFLIISRTFVIGSWSSLIGNSLLFLAGISVLIIFFVLDKIERNMIWKAFSKILRTR